MAAIMLIRYCLHCWLVLLSQRRWQNGERRDRQHPILEVTASIRSHIIALEGHNPVSRSATGNVCDRSGDTVGHDALDQPASHKSWYEPRLDLDICSAVLEFVHSSLRISRDRSLARADLWLGSVDFRLGAASNFSLGNLAVFRDRVFLRISCSWAPPISPR